MKKTFRFGLMAGKKITVTENSVLIERPLGGDTSMPIESVSSVSTGCLSQRVKINTVDGRSETFSISGFTPFAPGRLRKAIMQAKQEHEA